MAPKASERAIIRAFEQLVDPLNRALPGPTEVALHDLVSMPYEILAIAGNITGRTVGGPASDMLMRAAAAKDFSTLVGYESKLPDGRRLRTTTIIVRGEQEQPLAALCIISDVSMWEPVRNFVQVLLPGGRWPGQPHDQRAIDPDDEGFPTDMSELADHLLARAIRESGVPVALMHKRHKLAIVDQLQRKGFFQLREAAERAAAALEVTRYTVYNYLNELSSRDEESEQA